ncbi:hypothetical protein BsWGS_04380 [Bradybaena similaris]
MGAPPGPNLPPNNEQETLGRVFTEGLAKYVLPSINICLVAIVLMRIRCESFAATRFECFVLSALHYYAAFDIGYTIGMKLYEPILEQKVLEQMPNSEYAKVIQEARRYR